MAAFYNVPLGGALFAAEVLLGTLSLSCLFPTLATAMIATAVSWVSLPMLPTYMIPTYPLMWPVIPWAVVVGPLAGLLALLYIRVIGWAKRARPSGWRLIPTTLVVFTALGVVSIAYPQILGNGKDVVQAAFTNQLSLTVLAAVCVLKPLATAGCFRSGATGGLFTPTLSFGALFGGLLGHAWAFVWPGAPLASYAIIGATAMLAESS